MDLRKGGRRLVNSKGVLKATTTTSISMVFLILFLLFQLCFGEIHRATKSRPPIQAASSSSATNNDHHQFDFSQRYHPWACSIVASLLIGFSGVLPLFLIPAGRIENVRRTSDPSTVDPKTLRLLLSFAVGGLLGDVFLHLLPEAWHHMSFKGRGESTSYITIGLWVLAGIFTFIVIEMMFEKHDESHLDVDDHHHGSSKKDSKTANGIKKISLTNGCNGIVSKNGHHQRNGHAQKNGQIQKNGHTHKSVLEQNGIQKVEKLIRSEHRNVAGYLNLLANSIDNFTHGLAVAGSFLVSFKVGLLTTFAILIHEVPHEIGDFAILLKSGFNRLEAARAQMATAVVGIAGAVAALSAESAQTLGERTAWILPFTAGGFLNIALVNVLPDILQEKDPKESIKQVGCLFAGVGVMALVTIFCN